MDGTISSGSNQTALPLTVEVLTGGLVKVVSVDQRMHRMTVQAGMTVQQLINAVKADGSMALPLAVVPNFSGERRPLACSLEAPWHHQCLPEHQSTDLPSIPGPVRFL
jgi:hypothetical protein